ncbi:MAG: Replicative DNA helicase [Actinobacteria bacterium]|nr:Replicative DNA helicase [Actinomycetota bacterium]
MLNNHEAEASVIGAVLLDNAVMQDIDIQAQDFYEPKHQRLWSVICEIIGRGQPADIITVSAQEKELGALAVAYASSVPTTANVAYHTEIIRELALKRQIIRQCQKTMAEIETSEPEELLSAFQRIEKHQSARGVMTIGTVLKQTLSTIEKRFERQDTISGITSGFKDIDEVTDGWQATDYIILGGRPSMGKSSLAWAFAVNAAMAGHQPHICNVEMDNHSMVVRGLSIMSGIDIWRLRKGRIGRDEWQGLYNSAAYLSGLKITMDDTVARAGEIKKSISRAVRLGADIAFVDYLQLISPDTKTSRSRESEIGEISKALKNLTKQLRIPIIAVAQLSRECEKRPNKRPLLSDLRESGQIEQDADIVMFLYRDFYYTQKEEDKFKAELLIRKGRHIGNTEILLYFDSMKTKFANMKGGG